MMIIENLLKIRPLGRSLFFPPRFLRGPVPDRATRRTANERSCTWSKGITVSTSESVEGLKIRPDRIGRLDLANLQTACPKGRRPFTLPTLRSLSSNPQRWRGIRCLRENYCYSRYQELLNLAIELVWTTLLRAGGRKDQGHAARPSFFGRPLLPTRSRLRSSDLARALLVDQTSRSRSGGRPAGGADHDLEDRVCAVGRSSHLRAAPAGAALPRYAKPSRSGFLGNRAQVHSTRLASTAFRRSLHFRCIGPGLSLGQPLLAVNRGIATHRYALYP